MRKKASVDSNIKLDSILNETSKLTKRISMTRNSYTKIIGMMDTRSPVEGQIIRGKCIEETEQLQSYMDIVDDIQRNVTMMSQGKDKSRIIFGKINTRLQYLDRLVQRKENDLCLLRRSLGAS